MAKGNEKKNQKPQKISPEPPRQSVKNPISKSSPKDSSQIKSKRSTKTASASPLGKLKPVEKKKRTPKAHATRPTPADEVIIAERRALVLELRKSGASIRQIAKHLEENGYERCSPATVHADLEAELTELRERCQESAENLVKLELERLDQLQFCVWANTIRRGDTFGIYAILAIMDRRAEYLGLKKPKQIEIDAKEGLAKLLGVKPENLPDERA